MSALMRAADAGYTPANWSKPGWCRWLRISIPRTKEFPTGWGYVPVETPKAMEILLTREEWDLYAEMWEQS